MKRFTLALSLLLVLTFFATASAHSGGTDEYGGHVDHSTGEYHYHHGEPAHAHPNGICPYRVQPKPTNTPKPINTPDRTYSYSENSSDNFDNYTMPIIPEETPRPDTAAGKVISAIFTVVVGALGIVIGGGFLLCMIGGLLVVAAYPVIVVFEKIKEKRKR